MKKRYGYEYGKKSWWTPKSLSSELKWINSRGFPSWNYIASVRMWSDRFRKAKKHYLFFKAHTHLIFNATRYGGALLRTSRLWLLCDKRRCGSRARGDADGGRGPAAQRRTRGASLRMASPPPCSTTIDMCQLHHLHPFLIHNTSKSLQTQLLILLSSNRPNHVFMYEFAVFNMDPSASFKTILSHYNRST